MSNQSKSAKGNAKTDDDRMDSGMSGIDLILQNATQRVPPQQQREQEGISQEDIKKMIQEQLRQTQKQPQQVPAASAQRTSLPQETPKKKFEKVKEGLYFSKPLSAMIDREWKDQPREDKKSKSIIVEGILRRHYGMPPLEE